MIDRQIANIRRAIMDGLEDVAWANAELRKLGGQREELGQAATPVGKPPRIDAAAAAVYLQHLNKTLSKAGPAEARGMLRECVADVRLEPEALAVDVYYTLPPAAMEMGCEPSGTAAHRDRRDSGGVFVPDSYSEMLPVSTARWVYAPAKQGAREMRRIGLAA